jgi:alkyl hydroperoxide reductase subunit AhpC
LAWSLQPRKEGGLGPDLVLPLVADKSMQIAREYGVLIEEEGIALRGLFLIDPNGILRYAQTPQLAKVIIIHRRPTLRRQITVNDLPVGRSVDETLRLIKAFQFAVRFIS